jgi:hypothetical protein
MVDADKMFDAWVPLERLSHQGTTMLSTRISSPVHLSLLARKVLENFGTLPLSVTGCSTLPSEIQRHMKHHFKVFLDATTPLTCILENSAKETLNQLDYIQDRIYCCFFNGPKVFGGIWDFPVNRRAVHDFCMPVTFLVVVKTDVRFEPGAL